MIRPSRKLLVAIKLSSKPAYRVAIQAGFHPATLSRLLHGAQQIKPGDPRIQCLADALGLEAQECFIEADKEE